jgi:plasmid stability protein
MQKKLQRIGRKKRCLQALFLCYHIDSIKEFFMSDVLVRDVEKEILIKLKARAKKNGRSLQNELIQIFRSVVDNETKKLSDKETAAKIRKSLQGRTFSDSAELLREDRRR